MVLSLEPDESFEAGALGQELLRPEIPAARFFLRLPRSWLLASLQQLKAFSSPVTFAGERLYPSTDKNRERKT
jgi:hypothetical protein